MKSRPAEDQAVKRRLEVILRVRAGRLTATEGARELGVSRKTYYQWENRALAALGEALVDRAGGRPPEEVDEEKEALKRRIAELEERLLVLEQTQRIREALSEAKTAAQKK